MFDWKSCWNYIIKNSLVTYLAAGGVKDRFLLSLVIQNTTKNSKLSVSKESMQIKQQMLGGNYHHIFRVHLFKLGLHIVRRKLELMLFGNLLELSGLHHQNKLFNYWLKILKFRGCSMEEETHDLHRSLFQLISFMFVEVLIAQFIWCMKSWFMSICYWSGIARMHWQLIV